MPYGPTKVTLIKMLPLPVRLTKGSLILVTFWTQSETDVQCHCTITCCILYACAVTHDCIPLFYLTCTVYECVIFQASEPKWIWILIIKTDNHFTSTTTTSDNQVILILWKSCKERSDEISMVSVGLKNTNKLRFVGYKGKVYCIFKTLVWIDISDAFVVHIQL